METVFQIVQYVLLVWFLYWFTISLFGFGKARQKPHQETVKKFLVLIPAHNESNVISSLIDNLFALKYPEELFDVYVIADNCTDETADIARAHGAKVLEHTSLPGEAKGKPHAIRYAIENININFYDAVCIFDADNLVTLNYLEQMNNHLCAGDRLIQCYLDSKNPNDNWVTLGYATSYYFMNRAWQLAKSRLRLGNAIGGTGFCVERKLLQEVGWTADSLTEDLEFTMQALLTGVRATWCHHAKVYDEKPTRFFSSAIQRLRWARGHWDVCFRYAPKLLKRSILKADFRAFDGAMYLINPGKTVVWAMVSLLIVLSYFTELSGVHSVLPIWVWAILLLVNLVYVIGTVEEDSEQTIRPIKAFFSLILFNYSYVPLFFWSLLTFKKRIWVRTEHTRAINIDEVSA